MGSTAQRRLAAYDARVGWYGETTFIFSRLADASVAPRVQDTFDRDVAVQVDGVPCLSRIFV